MRLYRVVLRSGLNLDITAQAMLDDPNVSELIYFFADEEQRQLAATVNRTDVAGLILPPQKFGQTGALPRP
jgi:hypothetical protein